MPVVLTWNVDECVAQAKRVLRAEPVRHVFEKNNIPALIAAVGEDSIVFETYFPPPDLPLSQVARDGGRANVEAHARRAAQGPRRERREVAAALGSRPVTGPAFSGWRRAAVRRDPPASVSSHLS